MAAATAGAAPATLLARVQACWPAVAGPAIASEAKPVAERAGTLTVECSSGMWASELDLLGPDILRALNDALEPPPPHAIERLRVRATGGG